ncbi:MAG: Uma2 family endonuclease [Armatimonadota bacterium]
MAISFQLTARPTDEEILELSRRNPGLQIEQRASGELVLTPIGARTNLRELALEVQLYKWAEADGGGVVFSQSTGFRLPDGSLLSPDASWLGRERWEGLTPERQEGFAPLCPDVVFEILSRDDPFYDLRAKMRIYVANGARRAVLIDVTRRAVEVNAPDQAPQVHESAESVSLDPVLPGFTLDLREIFEVD